MKANHSRDRPGGTVALAHHRIEADRGVKRAGSCRCGSGGEEPSTRQATIPPIAVAQPCRRAGPLLRGTSDASGMVKRRRTRCRRCDRNAVSTSQMVEARQACEQHRTSRLTTRTEAAIHACAAPTRGDPRRTPATTESTAIRKPPRWRSPQRCLHRRARWRTEIGAYKKVMISVETAAQPANRPSGRCGREA